MASDAIAGIVDEVVGNHGDLEDVFDMSLTQLDPEHRPELGSVM